MISQDDIEAFKEEEQLDQRSMQMMMVNDPLSFGLIVPGGTTPALTILLYRVCDNNMKKFDEACRLINLFMDAAEKPKP